MLVLTTYPLMAAQLTKLLNKIARRLSMVNKFYKYFFIALSLAITTNVLSSSSQIYAEFECIKEQWTDKYSCEDIFNGSKYSGTGVVKSGWFIPSTLKQKTKPINNISEKTNIINSRNTEFSSLKKQKYQGPEIYLFFAVLFSIVSIVLITKNHRINIENTKDRQKMIDNLASKDAKKEIELAKNKIVKKANDKVYKKTVKLAELSQSKTRLAAIEEVENKIKSEYEKSADREKLKQDAFGKITNEILENVSEVEREEIKTNAMNDLVQEAREELIAKHSEEVNSNLNVDKIKKEVEKDIKDKHFIEVMDEVREEYKKTVFNNLSDEEIEGLKKEVYLEVKQGFSSKPKGSTSSNQKNTSSTLDDFIDSL